MVVGVSSTPHNRCRAYNQSKRNKENSKDDRIQVRWLHPSSRRYSPKFLPLARSATLP